MSINPTIFPLNQYQYPFNRQFYLILNVAVGGNFDSGRFNPSDFCIDSVCSNFSDNPDKKRKEIEEEMAKKQNPFSKAESFSVHEIIDPSETRKYLCGWIEKVQPQLKARLHIK